MLIASLLFQLFTGSTHAQSNGFEINPDELARAEASHLQAEWRQAKLGEVMDSLAEVSRIELRVPETPRFQSVAMTYDDGKCTQHGAMDLGSETLCELTLRAHSRPVAITSNSRVILRLERLLEFDATTGKTGGAEWVGELQERSGSLVHSTGRAKLRCTIGWMKLFVTQPSSLTPAVVRGNLGSWARY
jgi:hypothetical protein